METAPVVLDGQAGGLNPCADCLEITSVGLDGGAAPLEIACVRLEIASVAPKTAADWVEIASDPVVVASASSDYSSVHPEMDLIILGNASVSLDNQSANVPSAGATRKRETNDAPDAGLLL